MDDVRNQEGGEPAPRGFPAEGATFAEPGGSHLQGTAAPAPGSSTFQDERGVPHVDRNLPETPADATPGRIHAPGPDREHESADGRTPENSDPRHPSDPTGVDHSGVVVPSEEKEHEVSLRDEEVDRIVTVATEVAFGAFQSMSASYSGPIPDSAEFYNYHAQDRERILRMSEAGSTDESARRDRIVNASIDEMKGGRWMAFLLFMAGMVLSVITYACFGNIFLSLAFLAAPLLNSATSFLGGPGNRGRTQSSKRTDDEGASA